MKNLWIGLSLSATSLAAIALTASTASANLSSTPSANTLLKRSCRLDSTDSTLQDGSRYDLHQFAGVEGQSVTISLESSEFDPYLILEDPNGNRVGEHDDIDIDSDNLNARIEMTLANNGIYNVYTNSYDDTGIGTYTLLISSETQSPQPTTDLTSDCAN